MGQRGIRDRNDRDPGSYGKRVNRSLHSEQLYLPAAFNNKNALLTLPRAEKEDEFQNNPQAYVKLISQHSFLKNETT